MTKPVRRPSRALAVWQRPFAIVARRWGGLTSTWQQTIVAAGVAAVLAVVKLGGWWAGTVLLVVIAALVITVVTASRSDIEPAGYSKLKLRLGSSLSTHIEEDHKDRVHRYLLLERTDLLDYPTGDFRSIRRLCGVNESDGTSAFVPYVEHSDRKATHYDCRIRAYDVASRKELRVEPLEGNGQHKQFAVPFKIYFEQSLRPGREFDIVYGITLPGELDDLRQDDEMMSVFLGRITRGVDRLVFRVCLNFEPEVAFGGCLDHRGRPAPLDAEVSPVRRYRPEEWYEHEFAHDWSAEPYVVTLASEEPQYPFYEIRYKRKGA